MVKEMSTVIMDAILVGTNIMAAVITTGND
jgi:hypothetical protein